MLKPYLFFTLLKIAEALIDLNKQEVSASFLIKKFNIPQQTLSRHLKELKKLGLVETVKISKGETVKVTVKGYKELALIQALLEKTLKVQPNEIKLEGKVFSGLGEGSYYISQPGYKKQFIEKLGFNPYPGTLNVKIEECYLRRVSLLKCYPSIVIEGFSNGKRSFGSVNCYKALLEDKIEGAVISALRSHYGEDVLEIIAPVNLRETLKLKDGDKISFIVFPTR
jgi:riboflavin kinase